MFIINTKMSEMQRKVNYHMQADREAYDQAFAGLWTSEACEYLNIPHRGDELKKLFVGIDERNDFSNLVTKHFTHLLKFKIHRRMNDLGYSYECSNECYRYCEPKYKYINGEWRTNIACFDLITFYAYCDRCTSSWHKLDHDRYEGRTEPQEIDNETEEEIEEEDEEEDEEEEEEQEEEDDDDDDDDDDVIGIIDLLQTYKRNVVDGDCIICYEPKKL